jgi:hypothetical protein
VEQYVPHCIILKVAAMKKNLKVKHSNANTEKIFQTPAISQKTDIKKGNQTLLKTINYKTYTRKKSYEDKKHIRNLQNVIKKMVKENAKNTETIKKLSTVVNAQKKEMKYQKTIHINQQKEIKPQSNVAEIYKQALERFKKQGGNEDIERIKLLRIEFKEWESYFLKSYEMLEDLHYDLMEIIEQDCYLLNKEKRLMAFPIVFKNRSKNIDNFKDLVTNITNELAKENFTDELPDNLLSISGVNIRTSSDLDYFFNCSDELQEIQSFIKQSMNTILLVLKVLLKSKDIMLKLMNDIIQMKDIIYKKIEFFDAYELIEVITENVLKNNTNDISSAIDVFLQDNYKTARQTEELVDKIRKQYFLVLNRSIIKAYNDLTMGADNYASTASSFESHSKFLEEWKTIYTRLADIILSYLEKNLSIKKIECVKGDQYNDELHKPFDKSEKDDTLKTDMIKTVINEGFMMEKNNQRYVLKPVEVIVVNNQ